MELGLVQTQRQTLSPQMIQNMEVLQMPAQELLEHVQAVLQENPVLELQEHYDPPEAGDDLRRRLEWLEAADPQNGPYHRQDWEGDDPLEGRAAAQDGRETLYAHLLAQLDGLALDGETAACARALAASLDRNGWLEEDLSALARELGCAPETAERALAAVQSLDPAGVGARSLSECLLLQLARSRPEDRLAQRIAQSHLDELAKGRYGAIARALGAGQEQVRRACGVIRSLEPRPGRAFAAGWEGPVYITPDVVVTRAAGRLEAQPNERFFPALSVSPYYARLLRESGDAQVRDYLGGKLRQAQWLIQAVDQRRATLMACVGCLLEAQEEFFRLGPGHLKPLTMAQAARRMGVHESTVSRAVSGKYLQCAMGTYPLSFFFSRRLGAEEGGGAACADRARALIKELIAQEDKGRPLSDEKLCRLMARQGCALSRRTVAKYRDELGIPAASGRRAEP